MQLRFIATISEEALEGVDNRIALIWDDDQKTLFAVQESGMETVGEMWDRHAVERNIAPPTFERAQAVCEEYFGGTSIDFKYDPA